MSLFLLLLLLLKNPYSERNLISNLEPYPDTLHYLNPAINFSNGEGLYLKREERKIIPSVPPFYSFSISPIFLFTDDSRAFYFMNVIFALLSLYFLYLTLKKTISNSFIIGLLLFLYSTNYFIYWFPTLAMAENLILLLFNISVFLIVSKVSPLNLFLVGILGIAFFATKKASIPFFFSLLLIYSLKIFVEVKNKRQKIKTLGLLLLSVVISFIPYYLYEVFIKENNFISDILLILTIIKPVSEAASGVTQSSSSGSWFSLSYFPQNFGLYLNALVGNQMRFLWDFTPIVPSYIGILGIIGLIFGFFIKKFRFLSFSLVVFLISSILFISTFYTHDARYINHAIPTLIISFGIFLEILYNLLSKRKLKTIFYAFFILIFCYYSFFNLIRIKNQIVLNLKYAEQPWYYLSVKNLNQYFTKKDTKNLPIVISALPPYYIDFFSNGNYNLLPLSKVQEFRNVKEKAWGPNDYSDLINLYKSYLDKGYELYVSNHALGSAGYLLNDFEAIKKNFDLKEVASGCFNTCNIYKLNLKNE